MPDREKVMKELSWLILNFPVQKNPIDAADKMCNAINAYCNDALALLKEQEPKVLTLDGVCGGDECWIEYKYGGHGYADVYLEELDGTAKVYRCRPVGDRKPETVWLRDYGKLWRGWTYRPSEQQMRDTKWEGDSNAE